MKHRGGHGEGGPVCDEEAEEGTGSAQERSKGSSQQGAGFRGEKVDEKVDERNDEKNDENEEVDLGDERNDEMNDENEGVDLDHAGEDWACEKIDEKMNWNE